MIIIYQQENWKKLITKSKKRKNKHEIIEVKGSLSLKFWQCIRKATYLSDKQKRKMKVVFQKPHYCIQIRD
jgi:hypothetical protein